jgi:hypothetical protein
VEASLLLGRIVVPVVTYVRELGLTPRQQLGVCEARKTLPPREHTRQNLQAFYLFYLALQRAITALP